MFGRLVKVWFLAAVGGTLLAPALSAAPPGGKGKLPVPSRGQAHYMKLGMIGIVHWGLNTYVDREWGYGNTPVSVLKPTDLDPEQWVKVAKKGGLKRLVMVAKHHDGFCLWPSKYNRTYSIANAEWKNGKGDVIREFVDACKKHGIEAGIYVSPWDRYQASYATKEYTRYFHRQWDELLSGYGRIWEAWLDGANGGDGWYGGANEKRTLGMKPAEYYQFDALLRKLKAAHPMAVVFGGGPNSQGVSWCGSEAGKNPETCWHDKSGTYVPVEADTPMRKGGWFWHEWDAPRSLADLVEVYFNTVGRNSVLNLGLAPNKAGLIGKDDEKRLEEFGGYVRSFESVNLAAGAKRTDDVDGEKLTVQLTLPEMREVNAIDLGENLQYGQRVREWKVEAKSGGKWREVCSGTTVGYRRIQRFEQQKISAVRITLTGRDELCPRLAWIKLRYAPKIEPGRHVSFNPLSAPFVAKEIEKGLLELDYMRSTSVDAIMYVPPKDPSLNGLPDQYEVAASNDGVTWRKVASGEFGNMRANPVRQSQPLPQEISARYFRVKATRAVEGTPDWKGTKVFFYKRGKQRRTK